MNKRFLVTILTLVTIAAAAMVIIFLAKGYTFSPKDGKMVGTGIISVTSAPDGALVYIDGHLTTATNTTLSQLQPKTYDLKIIKEGYIPWEKQIKVTEGMVTEIKATLFPALPTIYPLTFNGVSSVLLSPDGAKLVFTIPFNSDQHIRQKGGVWVWTMSSAPISFSRGAEPHQLVASASTLDFSKSNLRWSPDSKTLLVKTYEGSSESPSSERNFLLPFDKTTDFSDLRDITPIIGGTLKDWDNDQKIKDEARISTITDLTMRKIASSSANLQWSPDETKFITGGNGKQKVYDVVMNKSYDLPEALNYFWLPDSKHVILVQEDKIAIAEFDGTNVAVIYAGKFEGTTVFPWPDSSRLVILTSYNTPTGSVPNLFGINLK